MSIFAANKFRMAFYIKFNMEGATIKEKKQWIDDIIEILGSSQDVNKVEVSIDYMQGIAGYMEEADDFSNGFEDAVEHIEEWYEDKGYPEDVMSKLAKLEGRYNNSIALDNVELNLDGSDAPQRVGEASGAVAGAAVGWSTETYEEEKSSEGRSSEISSADIKYDDPIALLKQKNEIIDQAIHNFKQRKTISGYSYDLRDNKKGDIIRSTLQSFKGEGMRNIIFEHLTKDLTLDYLKADERNITSLIEKFIYDQASSLTPKSTVCTEEKLDKFYNEVIKPRNDIYAIPELRQGLLGREVELSFGKMKRILEDFGPIIQSFPSQYREEYKGVIVDYVKAIEEATPKRIVKDQILAHFNAQIPVLKDVLKSSVEQGLDLHLTLTAEDSVMISQEVSKFINSNIQQGKLLGDSDLHNKVVEDLIKILGEKKKGGELNPKDMREIYEAVASPVFQKQWPILKNIVISAQSILDSAGKGLVIDNRMANKIISLLKPEVLNALEVLPTRQADIIEFICLELNKLQRMHKKFRTDNIATISEASLSAVSDAVKSFYKKQPEYHRRIKADKVIEEFTKVKSAGVLIKSDFTIETVRELESKLRSKVERIFDEDPEYKEMNKAPAMVLYNLLGEFQKADEGGKLECKAKLAESIIRFVSNTKDANLTTVFKDFKLPQQQQAIRSLKAACDMSIGRER